MTSTILSLRLLAALEDLEEGWEEGEESIKGEMMLEKVVMEEKEGVGLMVGSGLLTD